MSRCILPRALAMTPATSSPQPRDVLRDRWEAIRRELVSMAQKHARLTRAIQDRQAALARLEASAVLGAMLPARPRHE